MRKILGSSLHGLLVLAFAAAGVVVAGAQTPVSDARVISARAGGVNFVSGRVESNREGAVAWGALSDKDELNSGDVVKTGADGRVEVLLNPGSYLRVSEGAEFELADASLEDLRLKLTRGSAVVEATGYGETGLSILVETPHARVRLIRSGIYRFNVLPTGATEVAVQKGRVIVSADGAVVKGGHVVRFAGAGAPEVAKAKFEKRDRDALDLWSRERGKELAKMNEKVSARQVAAAFSSYNAPFSAGLHGLWYFNARARSYTFLPFYSSWNSPYGHSYWSRLYFPQGTYGYRGPRGVGPSSGPNTSPRGDSGGMSGAGGTLRPGGGDTARPQPVRSMPAPTREMPSEAPRMRHGRDIP